MEETKLLNRTLELIMKKEFVAKIDVEGIWLKGLAHDFPYNFNEIVSTYEIYTNRYWRI